MRLIFAWLIILVPGPAIAAGPLTGYTVILDAGHGGFDQGTKRHDGEQVITEAQLTWGVVVALQPMLEAEGARVVLTTYQLPLAPLFPAWCLFGQDTIPARGADVFQPTGVQVIHGDRFGLEQRLLIGRREVLRRRSDVPLFLSIHFDHVTANGIPAGARIIFPAGIYDTLLVSSLAAALKSDSLLRTNSHRPLVANGRSGLGKHLLILRLQADSRRVKEKKQTRRIYNAIPGTVMLELANLPNNHDWQQLQAPGSLRRYARVINQALVDYAQHRQVTPP